MQKITSFFEIERIEKVLVPSVLKAAIIKTFGYLIQHSKVQFGGIFDEKQYVVENILSICISDQVLKETNINVYIRNSWTLSFICNLFPIEDIISSKRVDPNESNLLRLVNACIEYANMWASNKEKVAASAIRACGFIA